MEVFHEDFPLGGSRVSAAFTAAEGSTVGAEVTGNPSDFWKENYEMENEI